MVLANCSYCGTLFNRTTSDVCLECYKEEEELFQETQDFIRRNPNTNLGEVLEHVDVEQGMLERWIEEERIKLNNSESSAEKTICIYCGRTINAGEYICKTCNFKKVLSQKQTNPLNRDEDQEKNHDAKYSGMHVKHSR